MNPVARIRRALAAACAAACLTAPVVSHAEADEVRIAEQYGLTYLPTTVMKAQGLLEKALAAAGLPQVEVVWSRISGSSQMTDAVLSGSLDFASGAFPNVVLLWDRTKGGVKAVVPSGGGDIYLVSRNPAMRSLKDYGGKERIAVPSAKTSFSAIVLQMAAADMYGIENHERFDQLTVAMPHPEAATLLMSGRGEVASHFSSPPFQDMELKTPGIHKVMSSADVFGGPMTSTVVWATAKFHAANPKIFRAFVQAYKESVDLINAQPRLAAEIYKRAANDKLPLQDIQRQITDSPMFFTVRPTENMFRFAQFMYRAKQIRTMPPDLESLFFPEVRTLYPQDR
ncbi:ABC transporter substrate-binding protein [Variovorax sp.]|uniref:ABC transporter substrate-binding protein n=1 Tax=Variovorax sp. TaxID=1871043 RepID=UPI002D32CEBC|nr:ABC transporter substrate-binding protein [Variovorax sp.]HYP84453.1 ABC transporter substrate-binding protein [Variovorax sp.]